MVTNCGNFVVFQVKMTDSNNCSTSNDYLLIGDTHFCGDLGNVSAPSKFDTTDGVLPIRFVTDGHQEYHQGFRIRARISKMIDSYFLLAVKTPPLSVS